MRWRRSVYRNKEIRRAFGLRNVIVPERVSESLDGEKLSEVSARDSIRGARVQIELESWSSKARMLRVELTRTCRTRAGIICIGERR